MVAVMFTRLAAAPGGLSPGYAPTARDCTDAPGLP